MSKYPIYDASVEKRILENQIFCNRCSTKTIHSSLARASITDVGDEKYEDPTFWTTYHVIQCHGCHSMSFMQTENDSMNTVGFDENDDEILGEAKMIFFPEHLSLNKKIMESKTIPSEIMDIYQETISLISKQMYRFASLGIRLIIEELSKQKGATKWGLQDKINELCVNKTITDIEKDILLKLKDYGDGAAHRNEIQPENILKLSVEIIESLLIRIYVFPEQVHLLVNNLNHSEKME